ncbi:J domain-containing protein [Spiroplasma monobiae]|uniref:J domain-containing protein n=1 Tax=Spiroplasma monobiae MQ-1 TaxID=1336748 RepID=A0A2K9LVS4_SPISQ|nr:J domain-containing protein [Spiroplasma monobiae]AUM62465.1 hypothetical protein SMONO_v1c02140 [Spiroplasma monobiae MQ-1]
MLLILSLGLTFIILIFIIFYLLKIFKNKNNKSDNKNIKKDLEDFKKVYQNQSNKKVRIEDVGVVETFNRFPFLSEFNEVFKKFPSETLINSLKHTQKSFYEYWANKEFDFFVIFEKLSKEKLVIFGSESLIKIYNEFCISIFNLYKETFINSVIPATISKFENEVYKLMNPEFLNDFVDSKFLEFCEGIDNIISTIEKEMYLGKNGRQKTEQQNFDDREKEEKLSKAYRVLEVSPLETDDKIRKSYLRLAKIYHPDKNDKDYAKQKMSEINDAYDTVVNDRKKN